jgi:acetyl-CoA carboxylase biotin carboxyl carrier protein
MGSAGSGAALSDEIHTVKSPMVGTFYAAPAVGAPPFVEAGVRVRAGQVLCIIEAMKLMNEIETEVEGEVVKCHAENGQPVEFGQPLFDIRPIASAKRR